MRCSTNVYLTALAIADIINLFCAFILSLQQYPGYKYGHVLYWSAFGLSNWFHDAALYSSVYLTVSFTLERYISVVHPLRGQVLCTESRAKKVITGNYLDRSVIRSNRLSILIGFGKQFIINVNV